MTDMTDKQLEEYTRLKVKEAIAENNESWEKTLKPLYEDVNNLKKGYDTYVTSDFIEGIRISTSCQEIKDILKYNNQKEIRKIERFNNSSLFTRLKKAIRGTL